MKKIKILTRSSVIMILISTLFLVFTNTALAYARKEQVPANELGKIDCYKFSVKVNIPGYKIMGKAKNISSNTKNQVRIWQEKSGFLLDVYIEEQAKIKLFRLKKGDIEIRLLIRVWIDINRDLQILIEVANYSGVHKYRGVYEHYSYDKYTKTWNQTTVKSKTKLKEAEFQVKKNKKTDFPTYRKELATLTYNSNPGLENLVAVFTCFVRPVDARNWLLDAVKYVEELIIKNKQKEK